MDIEVRGRKSTTRRIPRMFAWEDKKDRFMVRYIQLMWLVVDGKTNYRLR